MEKFNIIHLRDGKTLFSSDSFKSWRDIQDKYENYMASLSFDSKSKVIEYLGYEYKKINKESIKKINEISDNETIEIIV